MSAYRRLRMPRKRPQVLGVDLNCSESSQAGVSRLYGHEASERIICLVLRPQRLGDDDAYAVGRAADALHCSRIDSKLFRNDAHTGPPRSRQGLTDSFFECGGNWGPPEALSFTSGPRKPGTDSFCNPTVAELEAIFGWQGGGMASLYTRAADRARLAKSAMPKMAGRTTSEHSIPAPSGCGSDRGKISDFRGLILWWCGREETASRRPSD